MYVYSDKDLRISDQLHFALEQLRIAEDLMKQRGWSESWRHDLTGIYDKLAEMRDKAESAEALTVDAS